MLYTYLLLSCALVSETDYQDRIDVLDRFDLDGDGIRSNEDCNDNDPTLPVPWYRDQDGDGFGTESDVVMDCEQPEGYVEKGEDCDDTLFELSPLDADGDGASSCDGDCDDDNESLNLLDADGDGFSTCEQDCDDLNAFMTPQDADGDGISTCDGDCNDDDAVLTNLDADGDGFTSCDGDCDDADPSMSLLDLDGDGYSSCSGDCNDENKYIHPNKLEISQDNIDQDCDGNPDSSTIPSWNISYVTDNNQASTIMNDQNRMFFSWSNIGSEIVLLYREDLNSNEVWFIDSIENPRVEVSELDGNIQKIRMMNQESGSFIAYTSDTEYDADWGFKRHNSINQLREDIEQRPTGLQDFTAHYETSDNMKVSYIIDFESTEPIQWQYHEHLYLTDIVDSLNYHEVSDARIISFDGYFGVFTR